jgi:hypothetical protein
VGRYEPSPAVAAVIAALADRATAVDGATGSDRPNRQ